MGVDCIMADKIATRESYGQALLECADKYPELVVLDADLSGSTKTGGFAKKYPDRFFNMGIAEQNMIATAAGLAHTGLRPFASSFAMFASGRAWEQVRNSVAHNKFNVKIAATHAGITLGEDGASHQTIEDIAIMSVIPEMQVFVPADSVETKLMIEALLQDDNPAYIRLGRQAVPTIFDDSYKFEIGKAQIVREGTDITIIAYGIMVAEALEAAEKLQVNNISAEVINLSTIKPLDEKTILESISKTGKLIIAEEHNHIGGVNQQVAALIQTKHKGYCPMGVIAINDRFGQSGKPADLLKEYNLTAEDILKKAQELI